MPYVFWTPSLELRFGLQVLRGTGSREEQAHCVGDGRGIRFAPDDDPPVERAIVHHWFKNNSESATRGGVGHLHRAPLARSLKYEASICTPRRPARRPKPALAGGSPSTTTSGPAPPMADSRLPCSTSTNRNRPAGAERSLDHPGNCPRDGK